MAMSEITFTRSHWPDKRSGFGGVLFAGSDRVPLQGAHLSIRRVHCLFKSIIANLQETDCL